MARRHPGVDAGRRARRRHPAAEDRDHSARCIRETAPPLMSLAASVNRFTRLGVQDRFAKLHQIGLYHLLLGNSRCCGRTCDYTIVQRYTWERNLILALQPRRPRIAAIA